MNTSVFTFKEICEKTGYKPSVIRYYEKEFKLNIPRDSNSRRYFTQLELDKILLIKQLQNKGYTNTQIKRFMEEECDEIAAARDSLLYSIIQDQELVLNKSIINFMEEKFKEISNNLSELNQNIGNQGGQERDLLLSENMKLKMELKQKSYELIEIKEKLRYEKDYKNRKGFMKKLFGKR
jgi:DNA-binding transcriptional MerR regulator